MKELEPSTSSLYPTGKEGGDREGEGEKKGRQIPLPSSKGAVGMSLQKKEE